MTSLLLPLIALAATGIVIAIALSSRRDMRARLGDDVREIRLYRRWVRWTQIAFLGLALVFPVIAITTLTIAGTIDSAEIFPELARSLWLVSAAYGLSLSGHLLVGSRGMILGRDLVVDWKDVTSIAWDRDVGQRQWGLSIVMRNGTATRRHRVFINRERKAEVESLLDRYSTPTLAAAPTAAPSEFTLESHAHPRERAV